MQKKDASLSEVGQPATGDQTLQLLRRVLDRLRGYFAELLRVKEQDRSKIYVQVYESAEIADLNYWLEVIFSIGIAVLGLIVNSPAVVIGAMLISPLMGPIFGTGLAIALGDFYLGLKAVTNVILSVVVSVLLAAAITWILPFHSPTSEILSRVQPTLLDLAIAVLSGLAGAIVICRGGTGGGVTALPGVAVAVALMPPLGVVGFGVGIWNWNIVSGGGLLFLTNLVAIILSSVLVFFSIRMDAPIVRKEITDWVGQQKGSDVFYDLIQSTPLRRLTGRVGTLPRRMLILLIFLGVVCFPLVRTLNRIVGDARARRIALHDLESVIPKDSLIREDLDIGRELVRIRVMAVLPQGFSDDRREQLEKAVRQHTGRRTEIVVLPVATRAEIGDFAARNAVAPSERIESVEDLQNKLWLQLKPALASVWPSDAAPLLDASFNFSQNSAALEVHLVYVADADFGELGQEAVRKNLRERSGAKLLAVSFERIPLNWRFSFLPGSESLASESRRQVHDLAEVLKRFSVAKCSVSIAVEKTRNELLVQKRRAAFLRLLDDDHIAPDRIRQGPEEAGLNAATVKLSAGER